MILNLISRHGRVSKGGRNHKGLPLSSMGRYTAYEGKRVLNQCAVYLQKGDYELKGEKS